MIKNDYIMGQVSVLIPCYNGAKFIPRCCSCLLKQSYTNIQIIFINDGSSDESEKIFFRYKLQLEKRGMIVNYKYKENGGAASAINDALKMVTGEFVFLYDIDDILMEDAIATKVHFLNSNVDYAMVRSNGYYVMEGKEDIPIGYMIVTEQEKKNQNIFEDLVSAATTNLPGLALVRSSVLFEHLDNREIYVSQFGQNLQILMPVAYYGKCGYIDQTSMKYVIRRNSHSHTDSKENHYRLLNGYRENRINVIKTLKLPKEKEKAYINIANREYHHIMLNAASDRMDRDVAKREYKEIKRLKNIRRSDKINYYNVIFKPMVIWYKVMNKVEKILLKMRSGIKG